MRTSNRYSENRGHHQQRPSNRSRSSHHDSSRSSDCGRYSKYDREDSYSYRSSKDDRKQRNDENYDSRLSRKNTYDNKNNFRQSEQVSPLKRRNGDMVSSSGTESPSKRTKENSDNKCIKPFNLSNFSSPKKSRSSSLVIVKKHGNKPHNFSTPKSERRVNNNYKNKVKEMIEQNSIAMERNMSNNWADILEELEEQTKEVENYIQKVSTKYNIDAEKLKEKMETNAEVLRKRQKRINYGKVTAEYQRYILELPRKKRESFHPRTPNKFRKVSRRKFDGAIKKWRKLLHAYDEDPEQLADMKNSIETMSDYDNTDDFGGASAVGSGISGYNIDDFDILDSEDDKLSIEAPGDSQMNVNDEM